MAYSVLIADDFKMIREVFEEVVAQSDRYELAASLSSAARAVDFCREHAVDLVLLDVLFPGGMSGLEAARQIKALRPAAKLLVVTSMPEVSYIRQAREIGVDSFWHKEVQEQPILEIMDRTMAGESVYPDAVPAVMLGSIPSTGLTDRELEVLRELVRGLTNQQIADALGITERTVRMHLENMLSKTGFQSRLELAVRARGTGLIIND
ncbi:MAG: response regulator transcription factor [Ruminococcaceae bacterium]|nr:response regulator transcription factor [Oscillospiraceae bacterium]